MTLTQTESWWIVALAEDKLIGGGFASKAEAEDSLDARVQQGGYEPEMLGVTYRKEAHALGDVLQGMFKPNFARMDAVEAARARVTKFVEERATMGGIDTEQIMMLHGGVEGREAVLLLSDLRLVLGLA